MAQIVPGTATAATRDNRHGNITFFGSGCQLASRAGAETSAGPIGPTGHHTAPPDAGTALESADSRADEGYESVCPDFMGGEAAAHLTLDAPADPPRSYPWASRPCQFARHPQTVWISRRCRVAVSGLQPRAAAGGERPSGPRPGHGEGLAPLCILLEWQDTDPGDTERRTGRMT
jgi:hypothetical protein